MKLVVTYAAVFAALLLLLGLTVGLAAIDLGRFNLPVALFIAVVKVALIAVFFMRLRYERGLVWATVTSALVLATIGAVLTFSDYLTR
jgi:cytochrome c oxidase subunit 4